MDFSDYQYPTTVTQVKKRPPERPPPPKPKVPPQDYCTPTVDLPEPPKRIGSLRRKKVERPTVIPPQRLHESLDTVIPTVTHEEVPTPPKRVGSLRKKKPTVATVILDSENPPPTPLPRTIFFEPGEISC